MPLPRPQTDWIRCRTRSEKLSQVLGLNLLSIVEPIVPDIELVHVDKQRRRLRRATKPAEAPYVPMQTIYDKPTM